MGVVKPLSPQRLARRKELADAIRSGRFERGTGYLQRSKNMYCCLGVACRVAEQHGTKITESDDGHLVGNELEYQPQVKFYYGFTADEQFCLANLNDNRGGAAHTWDEIAAHIETGDLR